MRAHGTQLSLNDKQYRQFGTSDQTSSGYRNLFGDAAPDELYKGFANEKKEQDRARNREMFAWLAERLGRAYWPDGSSENRRIPAGYTYLAQFVIHDSVNSLADLRDLNAETEWLRNDRSGRLVLDTIYGRGMSAEPLLYGVCPDHRDAGGFLRIGGREEDPGRWRDLPRSPCPFSGKPAYSDVLIADARNDDNVIIAQLTVLFHLLHNIVYGELQQRPPRQMSDRRVFALARKVVASIYRKIVIDDLLQKLLHPDVYETYKAGKAALVEDPDDARMPLEFSHAIARFGHFMVRDAYQLNGELRNGETGLRSILQHTSSGRPREMPLEAHWLIEWKRLFGDARSPYLLNSRRLGPELARMLVQPDLFSNRQPDSGGLAYRDLLRGSESSLRSVASIVALVPAWVRELSPLAADGKIGTGPLVKWLNTSRLTPEQRYIECLTADIPLLLFVMIEAAETAVPALEIENGECLGAIGSFIIAEFLFGEYWRTHPFIEGDAETEAALGRLFVSGPPASMPALIDEIARRKGWDKGDATFW